VQVAPPCSPPPTWLQARQRASAESVSLPRRRHPCRSLSTERTLSPGPLDSPVGATSSGMPPRPPVAEAHPPPHSPEVGSAIRRAAAVRVSVTPPALLSHIRGLSARCYAPGRRRHASSALTRRRPAHGLGKLAFPERFDRPSGTPAQTRGLRVGRRFCAPSQIRCGRALTPAWRRHRPPRRAAVPIAAQCGHDVGVAAVGVTEQRATAGTTLLHPSRRKGARATVPTLPSPTAATTRWFR